jgi:hypothetical protein
VAGERTLVASDCRALEREVTLVLALAFGEGVELVSDKERAPSPGAAAQTTADATRAPEPTQKTAPKSPKASPEPPPSVSAQPDRTRSASQERLRAAVLAGGGVLIGTLPSPAGFVTAGATFGGGLWLDARVSWIPRVEQELAHGVSARYEGVGGALSGCAAIPFASVFSGCIALEGAALAGRASGATESVQAIAPLFSVAPVVAWQWPPRGPVSLRLEAALHVALHEPRFVVVGFGETYRVPLFTPGLDAVVVLSPVR